jgi:hypothetical protein
MAPSHWGSFLSYMTYLQNAKIKIRENIILAVDLCGFGTLSLKLMDCHIPRMFRNRVLEEYLVLRRTK